MPAIFVIMVFVFFSCENKPRSKNNEKSTLTEIKRILSPDKRTEAVLMEDAGNATVANFIQVYMVLPGTKIAESDRVYCLFNADHYSDVDIKWEKERNLEIKYSKARIFKFSNFWQNANLDDWNYLVELTLNCTSPNGQLKSTDTTRSVQSIDTTTKLGEILPVDSILGITVTNYSGRHKLSPDELNILKTELKNASFAGGLLIKPNHTQIKFQFKSKTSITLGQVYGSLGQIHFEGILNDKSAIDGTFILPSKINFDSYK